MLSSPLKVLARGYSITTKNEKVIKDIEDINIDDELKVQLSKGYTKCVVKDEYLMSDDIKYEEAIKQLEEIVLKLENGSASLDVKHLHFEKGTKLASVCSNKLKSTAKNHFVN